MTDLHHNTAIVILAAGKGTRMKSDRAKVLHELNSVPMIHYVVKTALDIAPDHVYVVVGHQAGEVEQAVTRQFKVDFATQDEQKGTGHAVQCALPYLPETIENVVILCGDVPLLTPLTVQRLLTRHCRAQSDITVLAVHVADPTGYGRIVMTEDGQMAGIVEEADADGRQKKITLINSGIYCVRRPILADILGRVRSDNAQGEFYLTDIIGIGYRQGLNLVVEIGEDFQEVIGINTLNQLERVEKMLRARPG